MPKVQYRSNVKPSTFAYPAPLEVPKEKEKEKVGERPSCVHVGCLNKQLPLLVLLHWDPFTCLEASLPLRS